MHDADRTTTHRTLCAVFAHPDDETFSMAATLARLSDGGVACHLFTATDGDAGRSSGLAVQSREELGRVRRAELLEAARVLGIRDVRSAGHRDGELAAVDADLLTGEIVRWLRQHRPQVVVTFGPEGAPNAHRDHRALSRVATAAFFLAGLSTAFPAQLTEGVEPHAPARLYYIAWPRPHAGAPIQVQSVPPTVRIPMAGWRQRGLDAFAAHRSQHVHAERFAEVTAGPDEHFALAAGVAQPAAMTDDLFAGL